MAGLEGLLAGRVLGGRYLIEEVIGRGGMGAVYRALDERLGRRVAIKVITLLGGDPEAVERLRARFHREARAAAGLPHHPNVVPVYDYGTDEALGLDYIVMELLRGQDLATRLAGSDPPPLSTGLRILVQAVRGVAVGHRSGLIHRDVKPGNIFLAQGDEREVQVRVVDFGIAKLVDDEDTANQLTQDGRVPHSPAFASPEQLRGLTRLTPASDVFSLGAVGYLLLTGRRPFSDADRNRMSLGMAPAPPLLRSSHPAIPAGVEVIMQKALAFDPADRFPDAGAMLEALEEAIRGIAETPLEPYAGVHFQPPVASPRTGGTGDEEDHTRILPDDAPPPVVPEMEDDATRILEEEDDRTLAAPPPPPARDPGAVPPKKAFPPRAPLKQKKSRVGSVVWTLVLLALAAVAYLAWLESNRGGARTDIPAAPDSVRGVGAEVGLEPLEEPDITDAIIPNLDGIGQHERGQYDSAAVSFRLAVQIDPEHAHYRRNLALALLQLGESEEAVEQLQRAIQLDPTLARAQFDLGRALLAAGDTAAALRELENFADRTSADRDVVRLRIAAISAIRRIRQAQAEAAAAAEADTAPLPPLPQPESIVPVLPADGDG